MNSSKNARAERETEFTIADFRKECKRTTLGLKVFSSREVTNSFIDLVVNFIQYDSATIRRLDTLIEGIRPIVQDRLNRTAALFNLKPCEYVKALLFKDLQVFDEPLDQRRGAWLQQKKKEADEDADLFENEPLWRTRKKRRGTQETLSGQSEEIAIKLG